MSNYWTALRQRKISRRTMLGASAKAGVGAAGLALVGCGGDDDDDAAPAVVDSSAVAAAASDAAAAASAASDAAAAAGRAADAAESASALAAEAAASDDAEQAAAAAQAAADAAADAAEAARAAGDAGAAAVAQAAAEAAEAAAAAAREAGAEDTAAAAAAAQAAADAAAAAAAAAGEASAAAAETASAAVAAAEEAAEAAREAADAAAMDDEGAAPMVSRYDTEATLRIGYAAFPASLDVNTDQGGAGVTNYLHFEPIYATDRGRNFLASGGYANWEFVDDNGAFLITIQPGIAFHNGEPLDAERLQWWFERNLGRAEYNPDYVSGIGARMGFVGDIQVVDDRSLHLTMNPPTVNAPEQTGGSNSLVVPRDYVVEHGDEHFARNPVGFGPYTFVSFTPDQRMESERWDDYFFPNPADDGPFNYYGNWAKTVVARYFPEESGRIAALEAGEIDVADRLSPDGAALFEASDDHHVITVSGLRVMGLELPINQSLDPITGGPNPWRDKRVREAANYAIDREAIIANLLSGHELPAVAPFPAGYDLPLGPSGYRDYDPDKARALLEEAGQVGVEIRLFVGTGLWGDERWMPAIQQYLNDAGFVCEVDSVSLMGALQEIRQHAVPYPFLMSQNGATKHGSPAGAAFAWSIIGGIGNPYSHTNPDDDFLPEYLEFQALIDAAKSTFDPKTRDDLYWDAAVIWYEEAYNIPLFNLSHQHGARKDISYEGWLHSDPLLNARYLGAST